MTRPKVAFVGSGGAARGIAHLGVLKACEELGIRFSMFVGASAGAIVAATYGQNIPLDVLIDSYRLPWRRRHDGPRLHASTFFGAPTLSELFDPGRLFSGLFSIDKLERFLAKNLPINDFRQLPHEVLVTAVDVDTGQRVVFGSGYDTSVPISQAVAASCCVPGLFRPYRIGSRYYLDGEIVRTLSADLAVEAGADVVVISNIYRPAKTRPHDRSIARRGLPKVINQSLNILLTEKERRGVELLSKLYPHVTFIDIAPNIGMYGYLNRLNARALILRGYRSALQALTEAKAQGLLDRPFRPTSAIGRLN